MLGMILRCLLSLQNLKPLVPSSPLVAVTGDWEGTQSCLSKRKAHCAFTPQARHWSWRRISDAGSRNSSQASSSLLTWHLGPRESWAGLGESTIFRGDGASWGLDNSVSLGAWGWTRLLWFQPKRRQLRSAATLGEREINSPRLESTACSFRPGHTG